MTINARTAITKALVEQLKTINGTGLYKTNIESCAYPTMKFWDEVDNFPSIYVVPGIEHREYLPGGFKWGFLAIIIKVYVKQEDPQEQLEQLLGDVEQVIDLNRQLVYDLNAVCAQTTEINIVSIVTDEGLLVPYGIGEITLNVQYQVM
jgi:hypothetical protein